MPEAAAPRAPRGGGEPAAAESARKKRKRPRKRGERPKSDSDSSSSSVEDEPEKPAKAKPKPKDKAVSAFPAMQAISAKEAEKASLEARTKFKKHCSSFLLGKCTRSECRFAHTVPAGFKAQARLWGYKQMGAAANGVEFE